MIIQKICENAEFSLKLGGKMTQFDKKKLFVNVFWNCGTKMSIDGKIC
jgi:hypothetical protein